ncbi:hypothetical protein EBB07_23030 [Paenibacillaceae bacterium]|nr:hypothetical protein EBB07_23030 [Paenibacillaceae bacterium]
MIRFWAVTRIRGDLSNSADIWEKISIAEAAKHFSYPLLRPQDSKFTFVKSFGVVLKDENHRVKPGDIWFYGIYDIFQWKQSEIVVMQTLNEVMTNVLKDPEQTMAMHYTDGKWENVEISDDVVAMFLPGSIDNYLEVNYNTADLNVIRLNLHGNASKNDLVKLAKTYLGK